MFPQATSLEPSFVQIPKRSATADKNEEANATRTNRAAAGRKRDADEVTRRLLHKGLSIRRDAAGGGELLIVDPLWPQPRSTSPHFDWAIFASTDPGYFDFKSNVKTFCDSSLTSEISVVCELYFAGTSDLVGKSIVISSADFTSLAGSGTTDVIETL